MEWDDYFIGIAEAVARKSHCTSHQFGAIAVNSDRQIVSTGYNGPPRGYPHCKSDDIVELGNVNYGKVTFMTCPRRMANLKSGDGLHFCPAAHAERNVLINAARYGIRINGCTLYITSPAPCRECAKEIVNAGIVEVVYSRSTDYPETGITGRKILETCHVKLRLLGE